MQRNRYDCIKLITFHQKAVVAAQAVDDLQVMGAGSERGDLLRLAEGKQTITVPWSKRLIAWVRAMVLLASKRRASLSA